MNDIIIVMGVSGSGKTTVAQGIATAMGWEFAEGDAFHPEANIAKMSSGHPLTDEDRWPWLRAIGEWIDSHDRSGTSAVITCSALRQVYRDILREGRPTVRFVHVTADPELIEDRMEHRQGHFMPASLLPSHIPVATLGASRGVLSHATVFVNIRGCADREAAVRNNPWGVVCAD